MSQFQIAGWFLIGLWRKGQIIKEMMARKEHSNVFFLILNDSQNKIEPYHHYWTVILIIVTIAAINMNNVWHCCYLL